MYTGNKHEHYPEAIQQKFRTDIKCPRANRNLSFMSSQ